jgi:iron complex transport system substrate-binding protein
MSLEHLSPGSPAACRRIVSLLPSATEIVCALGLGDRLVGVTHECDHPPEVRGLPRVTRSIIPPEAASAAIDSMVRERLAGGAALYSLDIEAVERLAPDLIVTQRLCDVCAVDESQVASLVGRLAVPPAVVTLEPTRLEDVFESLLTVGSAGEPERARAVLARLRHRVEAVAGRPAHSRSTAALPARPRVVLLEWVDPPFSSGHWTPEIVRLAGGVECLGREGEPSRTLAWEEVLAADPDVLIVACCGFDLDRGRREMPILEGLPGYDGLAAVRSGRVHLLDGNAYFSRPGPRLVEGLEILARLLDTPGHPPRKTRARSTDR